MDPILDERLTPGARLLLAWILRHSDFTWNSQRAAGKLGMSRSAVQGYILQLRGAGILRTVRSRTDRRKRMVEILEPKYLRETRSLNR